MDTIASGLVIPAREITRRQRSGLLRLLAVLHRWVGVGLCIMFALWFASGAVLLFVPFPSLSAADRLAHLPPVRTTDIGVDPQAAIAASGLIGVSELRLIQSRTAPLYVIRAAAGTATAVSATDGQRIASLSRQDAAWAANVFTGRQVKDVAGPFAYDQWIVHQQFDWQRPFYRVALDGTDGLEVYVSARTGDIVQQTRQAQRTWNYLGAVIHWIYPTIIRRSFALWDNFVWCLSLVGVSLALSGITLGLVRASRSLHRVDRPSISPFRGLFRWHHVTGLGAGLFLLSWIFSGWLSMDHGRLFSTGSMSPQQSAAYHGMTLETAARQVSVGDLTRRGAAQQIALVTAAGRAFLVTYGAGPAATTITDLSRAEHPITTTLPEGVVSAAVHAAWPGARMLSLASVAPDDSYEHLATEPDPGSLTRVVLDDPASTWVEIDTVSGQVRTLLDRSRRIYRWVYYGMHTLDLPGLSTRDTLRKTIILCLLACGEGLSLTGVILGARKIMRSLPRRRRNILATSSL